MKHEFEYPFKVCICHGDAIEELRLTDSTITWDDGYDDPDIVFDAPIPDITVNFYRIKKHQ